MITIEPAFDLYTAQVRYDVSYPGLYVTWNFRDFTLQTKMAGATMKYVPLRVTDGSDGRRRRTLKWILM